MFVCVIMFVVDVIIGINIISNMINIISIVIMRYEGAGVPAPSYRLAFI